MHKSIPGVFHSLCGLYYGFKGLPCPLHNELNFMCPCIGKSRQVRISWGIQVGAVSSALHVEGRQGGIRSSQNAQLQERCHCCALLSNSVVYITYLMPRIYRTVREHDIGGSLGVSATVIGVGPLHVRWQRDPKYVITQLHEPIKSDRIGERLPGSRRGLEVSELDASLPGPTPAGSVTVGGIGVSQLSHVVGVAHFCACLLLL